MPSDQETPKTAQSSQNFLWSVHGDPRFRKLMRLMYPLAFIHFALKWTLQSPLIGSTIPEGALPALRTVGDLAMHVVILGSFVGCWMIGVACVQWVRTRNTHPSG
jgi:hypothetical protein